MAENGNVITLKESNFSETVASGVSLVDFHAVWCGPCKMLVPIIEQVAQEFGSKAKIAKVDIDQEQKIAAEYQVTSVPTMILFKDGKEIKRLIGLRDVDAIKEFISSAL